MKNKYKYPSRQVRRSAERRKAKRLTQKKQAQKGNQKQNETEQSDKPKRKIDWKFVIDTVLKLALLIWKILNSCR